MRLPLPGWLSRWSGVHPSTAAKDNSAAAARLIMQWLKRGSRCPLKATEERLRAPLAVSGRACCHCRHGCLRPLWICSDCFAAGHLWGQYVRMAELTFASAACRSVLRDRS
mmetsp:Transcript_45680/g.128996  ORF Transcript_45680/g.128996 Transcript_45680/m.128996 type:complete len:111 (-) Transcript_45680:196-528(-)